MYSFSTLATHSLYNKGMVYIDTTLYIDRPTAKGVDLSVTWLGQTSTPALRAVQK